MQVADLIINGILQSSGLVVATLAITLIFKTSITTNFAQGMIGAFASFLVAFILMPTPDITGLVPEPSAAEYLLAITAGVMFGTLFSALIDILIFRKSKYSTPVNKQIVTMGVVLVISGVIPLIFGVNYRSIPRLGINLGDTWIDSFFNWIIGMLRSAGSIQQRHIIINAILAIFIVATIFIILKYTKWGLGVRATASNEKVASLMGVNTHVITAVSWALAGGMGTLAAIIIASSRGTYGNINTYFMVTTQVQAFFSAILGGFSTFYGPVIGAVLFSTLNNVYADVFNPWGTTIVYTTVLLIVLIKPTGIFGKKRIKKV